MDSKSLLTNEGDQDIKGEVCISTLELLFSELVKESIQNDFGDDKRLDYDLVYSKNEEFGYKIGLAVVMKLS